MTGEEIIREIKGLQKREIPENRGEGTGIPSLVEIKIGESGGAGDDDIAAETAGEFLTEEIITRINREIPGIDAGTRGDRTGIESVFEVFENLGILPMGFRLDGDEKGSH